MIASRKFNDFIPFGIASCQADGAHHCFCAGIYHPHHFYGGNQAADQFCHFHFYGSGGSKAQPPSAGVYDAVQYPLIGMPQNHRPPGAYIINVLIAVLIIKTGPFPAFDKSGNRPHRAESPYRRIDAARHYCYRFLK